MDEHSKGRDSGETLSPDEASRLSSHVAGVASSGLPLGPGLLALAEETPRGGFRNALIALADAIERGEPLEEAVDRVGGIPPHLRGLTRAGLRSGDLGDVLGRYSAVAGMGVELKRSFWMGLAYPMFALLLGLALCVLVDLMVIHKFESLFIDFGVPLPLLTIALLESSRLVRIGWPILVTLALMTLAAWLVVGLVLSRAVRNSLLSRLPVVGTIWRFTSWAEFCHLLAMLLEAKLPLPEALRLTGEGVENRDVELACRAMATRVDQGASLATAMEGREPRVASAGPFDHLTSAGSRTVGEEVAAAKEPEPSVERRGRPLRGEDAERLIHRTMPRGLPQLLRWAEGREATAEVLHMAGESFLARSRAEAAFGGSVVAFVAMILLVFGVFLVVIALFIPLVQVTSLLAG